MIFYKARRFLTAAVVAVPLAQGPDLVLFGIFTCGIVIIGPGELGLISDVEAIMHFAEFGFLLLFLIGLELNPRTVAKCVGQFGTGWSAGCGDDSRDCQPDFVAGHRLAKRFSYWHGVGALFNRNCITRDRRKRFNSDGNGTIWFCCSVVPRYRGHSYAGVVARTGG